MLEYIMEQMNHVVNIDSPTGYHFEVQNYVMDELKEMGYEPYSLRKGGVIVNLGGEGNPTMLLSHMDTLGCFVHYIKADGRLAISNLTLNPNNIETEQVRVITREGNVYEGTIQLVNASVHVNDDINQARKFDNLEVVLDEDVTSVEDVTALGIQAGDVIAVEPRFTVTSKGYIKSRYLDDKASVAILLGYAKYLKEDQHSLKRNIWLNFTVHEEIGYGAATGIPDCIEDVLSVDMGCVGEHLACTEKMVSICAKDSAGAYHREMVNELIAAAKKAKVDYAVDVYPHYSSDAQVAVKSGYDVRHGLIGPGVYASHGYERSHKEGIANTFELIKSFCNRD
ncbi:deblocking aminopeptidase [Lachnospiraceae bacterium KM106-2]|nr:deblocking aminopeptidase [Lachnospiraceae bacterium KM106-2]